MINQNVKSTFIRKRGNKYHVYIEYIDDNNNTKQKSQGSFINKKEADKLLIEIKNSVFNGKYIIPKNINFHQACLEHIKENSDTWSPSTIQNSTYMVNKHFSKFKNMSLENIKPIMLQTFFNEKHKDYSYSSLKDMFNFMNLVFKKAYRLKMIPENPCDFIEIKNKKSDFEAKFYSTEELKLLFEKIQGSTIELPVLIAALCGLRCGEICALRWSDIDFENKSITVNQTALFIRGQGLIYKEPKTDNSKRTLTVPDVLIDKLKSEKIRQNKLKLESYLDNYEDLVCLSRRNTPRVPQALTTTFGNFLDRNNLRRIRMHDLRHTNASVMLLSGVSMKVVSARLGHSDINFSMNKYTHILEELDHDASDKIANTLFDDCQ